MQALSVELAPEAEREVVLGTGAMACEWTGRVLLPHGDPLRVMALAQLELTQRGTMQQHRVGQDGAFSVRAEPGAHDVALHLVTGQRLELGSVDLPQGVIERDLSIPGGVVRVRPVFVAASGTPRWPRTALRVSLQPSGGLRQSSIRGMDGNDWFFGVAPGEYRLQCWPHPVHGAPREGMAVLVPENLAELQLDVTVIER